MNKIGSWLLAAASLVALLCGVGFLMPPGQMVQRTVLYSVPADDVWDELADFGSQHRWRSDVDRVQALADRGGNPTWREMGEGYERTYEVTSFVPGRHLVLRFSDPSHWFQGQWSFDLEEEGSRTRVTITESGEVGNVLMRLVCRTVVDRGEPLDRFLVDLGGVLGQDVHPTGPVRSGRSGR